jgi:hypothetical protein
MATIIKKYNGNVLTEVADNTIDTTSASIKFPGRGYQRYGEPVNENMLWIMTNFASSTAPSYPQAGQQWWDTANQLIKVYDGSSWASVGGVIIGTTPPTTGTNTGAFWYDTANKQMYTWNGTAWDLLGPLGSQVNTDPINPSVPSYSQFSAIRLKDTGGAYHQVWRTVIGGNVVSIMSSDGFTPSPAITGFTTIIPGLNLNKTISNIGVGGDTTIFKNNQNNSPITSNVYTLGSSSNLFTSVYSSSFNGDPTLFKSNQNNIPDVNNTRNLGSSGNVFANIYATNFIGSSSSAKYADLAERYEADDVYEPGTLVSIGGEKEITMTRRHADNSVFGIISTDPAYTMNSDAGNNETHPPVALIGRVPCKVVGQVHKGQRLMSSDIWGVAMAWDELSPLTVIARSLVNKTTDDVELIEVVLDKN